MNRSLLFGVFILALGTCYIFYVVNRAAVRPQRTALASLPSGGDTMRTVAPAYPAMPEDRGARVVDPTRPGSLEAKPFVAANLRVVEDPELREFGMRQTMRDWAEFFAKEKMPREREEILVKLLVEWTLASSMEDRAEIDGLISRTMDAQELRRFFWHRDEIPVKDAITQATRNAEKVLGLALDEPAKQAVNAVVRAAPLNRDSRWKKASEALEAGRLKPGDIELIERGAVQDFEAVLTAEGAALSETQRAALRQWYRESVLAFNVRALRNGLAARP